MTKTKEELIEIAKKPLKKAKEILGDYNDVQKFALMNKIKSDSTNMVPTFIVYEYYVQWCASNDMTVMARNEFFKKFGEMFERVKKNGDIKFLVSGQGMDMNQYSSSEKEVLRVAYSKRISANATKKEKQKRAKKVF